MSSGTAGQPRRAGASTEVGSLVRGLFGIIEKRKWIAIGMFVGCVSLTFVVTEAQRPVYRATASVIVERRSPAVLARKQEVIEVGGGEYWSDREFLNTQLEILRSRRLAKRVVDRLSLGVDEHFLGLNAPGSSLTNEEKRHRMASMDAAGILMQRVWVEPLLESKIVLVSVEDVDPHVAAQLANTVVGEYREENLDSKRSMVSEAMSELRTMLVQLKRDKETAEKRVLDFERRHAVGSFQGRREALSLQLRRLNEEHVNVRIRRIDVEKSPRRQEIEARLSELREALSRRDPAGGSHPVLVASAALANLRVRKYELDIKFRELAARYGEKHPEMQAIGGQRKLVLQASDREARAILQSRILELEAELEGHKEELGKILRVEEELTRELKTAQEKEATLVRLEVDYQPLSQAAAEAARRYEEVHTRYAETALANQLETNNVRIQDLAQAPTRPVKPNRSLNMAVGIVIGLLLGIGMVFFVESLDSTLKTREDIELAVPNLSFLGLVPAVSETGAREDGAESVRQLFVHLYPKSNITESFRTVRTNLLFATPNRKPRVIVVTSPGAKEGKTTVTANLAAISAVSGSRTVIIDTDMRRPRVHKLLGLPRRPGITECYFSSEPVSRFVQSTGVEGLDVLTCGALSANPVEIIESARFRNMIDELLGLYDTVFLDSPPVLAVADAKIVASMVEVVVMVVRAGVTARDSLREAVGLLEPVMGDSIGVVLNCFDVEKHSYRYYYYRSKKYSYYSYYSYGDPEVDNQLVDGRPDTTGTPTASSSAGDPQLLDSERDRGA